ncbi:hypothetical protein EVAR_91303_1 [Eumeta japonica]|uniref:Uncharacterized protein n=1 Tax=Eumeta variegata TaxID=151549 RepID=A0A4C1TS82_EUMVA|nr:hypothetical protein EVAR_91303_1 [Eumeta japonica]
MAGWINRGYHQPIYNISEYILGYLASDRITKTRLRANNDFCHTFLIDRFLVPDPHGALLLHGWIKSEEKTGLVFAWKNHRTVWIVVRQKVEVLELNVKWNELSMPVTFRSS